MKSAKTILKSVGVVAVLAVVAIQFVGPAKSNPTTTEPEIVQSQLHLSPQVAAILGRSCDDCHSNKTRWPWYSNVAPVSWFVINHVNEGRRHLNLSEWGKYDKRQAGQKLDQMCKEVKSGGMPLSSYTPLHAGSKLSSEDVKVLCDWTRAERQRLET